MININILASGSKGNGYVIDDDGGGPILIDPGIRFADLQKKMGFQVAGTSACLLSHEHQDHAKAVKQLQRLGIPLAMSAGTKAALKLKGAVTILESEKSVKIGAWDILPFETQHDAAEPLGFLLRSPGNEKLLYATDTYYIKYRFSKIDYYMVEANYSEKLLQESNVPDIIKRRIRASHFEIDNVKEFFAAQDLSMTKLIYLIHLSENHSDQYSFKKIIETTTGVPTKIAL